MHIVIHMEQNTRKICQYTFYLKAVVTLMFIILCRWIGNLKSILGNVKW